MEEVEATIFDGDTVVLASSSSRSCQSCRSSQIPSRIGLGCCSGSHLCRSCFGCSCLGCSS